MNSRLIRTLWFVAKIAAVVGVVAFVAYQLHFRPITVETTQGAPGRVVAEVMGTGTLEAKIRARLGTRVQGRVISLAVEQNERVSAGQQLVVLESADREQELALAHAVRATAQAARERVAADRARSQAVHEQALRDHERMRELFAEGAVSPSQLEKAAEAKSIAMADLARVEAAMAEADRQVEEAAQRSRYQETRLAETRIDAPFDGIVVQRLVDPGDFVVPGSTLLDVISDEVLWVSAWVDETALTALSPGMPARVVFRAEPEQSYPGSIARWNREVDRETRQFLVDVQVQELPRQWSLGQRAEVFLQTAQSPPDAFTLPANAVLWREGEAGVFTIDNDRATWRPVTLGLRGDELYEILSGVDAQDEVILPQAGDNLQEGRRVRGEPRPS